MTDAMTRPMVTDAVAAEWREWGKDDTYYWGSEPIVRLLRDRERSGGCCFASVVIQTLGAISRSAPVL